MEEALLHLPVHINHKRSLAFKSEIEALMLYKTTQQANNEFQ
jgi:hypothetical protein